MTDYSFAVSPIAREYCERILDEMVRIFNLDRVEALDRMNKYWGGQPLESVEDVSLLTHELPEFWAKQIYYGPNVDWWLNNRPERPGL